MKRWKKLEKQIHTTIRAYRGTDYYKVGEHYLELVSKEGFSQEIMMIKVEKMFISEITDELALSDTDGEMDKDQLTAWLRKMYGQEQNLFLLLTMERV